MKPRSYLATILLSLCFLIYGIANAQSPNWLWAKAFGGTGGNAVVTAIAVDPGSGDIYATGEFYGTFDFDPGPGNFNLTSLAYADIFITKLDGQGNFLWAKAIEGANAEVGRSIVFDPSGNGGVYFAGIFSGDPIDFDPSDNTFILTPDGYDRLFICKFDGSGNFLWAKGMEGTFASFRYLPVITVDPSGSGDIYATGAYIGTIDLDPGPETFELTSEGDDIFICKLNSSGNLVWAKSIGGPNDELSRSIVVDHIGNVYTTGSYSGTVDFDPGAGTFNLTSAGFDDIFISKLDNLGNFVWTKSMGGLHDDVSRSIAVDATGSGDIYTTGYFSGTADFDPNSGIFNLTSSGNIFISKLNASGNFLWAKAIGVADEYSAGRTIGVDPSGNGVCIVGYFEGNCDFDPGQGIFNLTSAGGDDVFILKLDDMGNLEWAKSVGGLSNDGVSSIRTLDFDASGNINLVGFFKSQTISFGTTNLTYSGNGENEVFIAKLENTISAVSDAKKQFITLYPNPVTDYLLIQFQDYKFEIKNVNIYNTLGQTVTRILTENIQGDNIIDVSLLSPGIYFIEITSSEMRLLTKFLKE